MADGNLIFDTKIDTSGIDDGVKELKEKKVTIELPVKGKVDQEETQRNVESVVKKVDAPPVKLTGNAAPLTEAVQNAEIPEKTINITPDADLDAQISEALDHLTGMSIDPTINTTGLKEQLDSLLNDVNLEPEQLLTKLNTLKDSISIRVPVDLDHTAKQYDLDAIETYVNENLNPEAKASVTADKQEVQKNINEAVDSANPPTVKIQVETEDGWVEQLYGKDGLISTTPIEVPVKTKIDDADHKALVKSIEKKQLEQDVKLQAKEEEYAKKRAEIEASALKVPVDPDMSGAEEKMSWLERKLQGLSPTVATAIGSAIGTVVGRVGSAILGKIGDEIKEAVAENEEVTGALESLDESIDDLFGNVIDTLSPIISDVAGALETAVDWASQAVTAVGNLFFPPKNELSGKIEGLKGDFARFEQQVKDSDTAFAENKTNVESRYDLAQRYLATLSALEQKDVKTDEDVAAMRTASDALANLYPDLKSNLDPVTGLFADGSKAISGYVENLKDLALFELYDEKVKTNARTIAEAYMNLGPVEKELANARAANAEAIAKQSAVAPLLVDSMTGEVRNIDAATAAYLLNIPAVQKYYDTMEDGSLKLNESAKDLQLFGEASDGTLAVLSQAFSEYLTEVGKNVTQTSEDVKTLETEAGTYYETIDAAKENTEELKSSMEQAKAAMQSDSAPGSIDSLDEQTRKAKELAAENEAARQRGQEFAAQMARNAQDVKQHSEETKATQADVEASVASVEALAEKIQTAVDKGTTAQEALSAIKEQVDTESQSVMEKLDEICLNLGVYMTNLTVTLNGIISSGKEGAVTAGAELALGAGQGYQSDSSLVQAASDGTARALAAANSYQNAFGTMGYNMAAGVAGGFSSGAGLIESAVQNAILRALAAGRKTGKINSPSKLFDEELGYDLGAGVGVGWERAMPDVLDSMKADIRMIPAQLQPEPKLSIDYGTLSGAIWANAPQTGSGGNVYIDGVLAGKLLSGTVSREIEQDAWAGRYGG